MQNNAFGTGLVADASDLNLSPGTWPETLTVEGDLFIRVGITRDGDDDVVCATYVNMAGRQLVVFND